MATKILGKVGITSAGAYNSNTTYSRLTAVVGEDGNTYLSSFDGVVGVSPGVTSGWQSCWTLFVERGVGIESIELTSTSGNVDTYTITYDNGATSTFTVTNGVDGTTYALTNNTLVDGNGNNCGAVDFSEINDEIAELDSTVTWKAVEYENGYIACNNSSITDFSRTISSVAWRSSLVECDGGDLFSIHALGGASPRAYAFVDTNGKVLETCANNSEIHAIIKAPANSTKLIINDKGGNTSFQSVEPLSGYDALMGANYATHTAIGSKNQIARLGWDVNMATFGAPPEQSIASYKLAYRNNCRIMLADVRLSADGVFVGYHDADLSVKKRVRNSDGTELSTADKAQLIADLTLAQLNQYDYGIGSGAAYAGTGILQIEDFLAFCSYTNCVAVLEVKVALTSAQWDSLAAMCREYGMIDRVIISDVNNRLSSELNYISAAFPDAPVFIGGCDSADSITSAMAQATTLVSNGHKVYMLLNSSRLALWDSALIAQFESLGGGWAYTEVESESDIESLQTSGWLKRLKYISSSYVNINEWCCNLFGL